MGAFAHCFFSPIFHFAMAAAILFIVPAHPDLSSHRSRIESKSPTLESNHRFNDKGAFSCYPMRVDRENGYGILPAAEARKGRRILTTEQKEISSQHQAPCVEAGEEIRRRLSKRLRGRTRPPRPGGNGFPEHRSANRTETTPGTGKDSETGAGKHTACLPGTGWNEGTIVPCQSKQDCP